MTDKIEPSPSSVYFDEQRLRLNHLEEIVSLHRVYQKEAVDRAYTELQIKLAEMNKFREENRELTAQFCTTEMMNERINQLHLKIDAFKTGIDDGIGKRVTTLELYRANIDGRLAVWGAVIILLTLFLQFYPTIRGKF